MSQTVERRPGRHYDGPVGDAVDDAAEGEVPSRRLPVVAVAGRPNVGKSSLVNRIVGRRAAVVQEQPGVTRDRKELEAEWAGVPFVVVDTGGWSAGGGSLDAKVREQAERAVADADLVLLVVDNTVDDASREAMAWELVGLGMGDPWPVSALHGRSAGDLLDEVVRRLPAPGAEGEPPAGHRPPRAREAGGGRPEGAAPRVALVGRPNVGKSTLFNRLIGEERAVVHDMPGTTRDAIDTVIATAEGPLCFVDTAGMRRPSRAARGVESYSILRALEALDRADLSLLVIDATVGATHQDQRLAERIGAAGCPAVVVLNKWDLVPADAREDILAGVGERLAFLGLAPVLRVSAATGRGVHRILPALHAAVQAYHHRVPTGALNRALRDIQAAHPAPGARIRYGVQGAVDPPTFTLFTTGRLPQTYLRYVGRGLRERFELGSTPLKLRVRIGGR